MTGRVPASRSAGARSAGARLPASRPVAGRSAPRTGMHPPRTPRTIERAATARPGTARPAARPAAPGARSVPAVSSTSAERFAARVRRRRQKRAVVTGSAMAMGLILGWLLFGSTALAVQHIEVRGTHRVPAESVRAAVQFEVGHSMAMISPQAAAQRVVALRLVRSAKVVRSWPSTLVVQLTEREPIAAVPARGGGVALVDGDGVVVETDARAPAGLPLLDVDVATAGAAAVRAARQVSDDLPARLRSMTRRISAASPDSVTLTLSDSSTVSWGSSDDGARKAEALLAVHPRLTSHPAAIDVSAPGTPAVTDRSPG